MDIKSLIGMSFVCAMGAISPGPSLAVVMRNTISGGRMQGIMTGIGHGLGFSIYAFIAVMGLSSLLFANEDIFHLLQWAGVLVLIWMGFNMITHKQPVLSKENECMLKYKVKLDQEEISGELLYGELKIIPVSYKISKTLLFLFA